MTRASFAPQADEAFTIYAAAEGGGLGLGDDSAFEPDSGLGADLYSEESVGTGLEEPGADDFALDLSDATGVDETMPSEPVLDEVSTEPEAQEADSLDFNLDSGEFADEDVEVGGMGIDLESPEAEVSLDDEPEVELDLGGDDEPEVALDLGDDEPEVSLDLGDDEPEVELDLGGDDEPEVALDLGDDEPEVSLDLGDDEPEVALDLGDDEPVAAPEEPSIDDGLELDGLELDLDLDEDDK